ncbi:hypothetical protein PVAP13_3NG079643 [Panicum virgatum]|uniref:Uncharacterized protein n=1 Tax=Panicum virgatum TaxID=38727 RepID=A0A8T0UDM5_PANVG|nr:hypothetical protein PVAP13_3NG079643 [Panicum virgatum]
MHFASRGEGSGKNESPLSSKTNEPAGPGEPRSPPTPPRRRPILAVAAVAAAPSLPLRAGPWSSSNGGPWRPRAPPPRVGRPRPRVDKGGEGLGSAAALLPRRGGRPWWASSCSSAAGPSSRRLPLQATKEQRGGWIQGRRVDPSARVDPAAACRSVRSPRTLRRPLLAEDSPSRARIGGGRHDARRTRAERRRDARHGTTPAELGGGSRRTVARSSTSSAAQARLRGASSPKRAAPRRGAAPPRASPERVWRAACTGGGGPRAAACGGASMAGGGARAGGRVRRSKGGPARGREAGPARMEAGRRAWRPSGAGGGLAELAPRAAPPPLPENAGRVSRLEARSTAPPPAEEFVA